MCDHAGLCTCATPCPDCACKGRKALLPAEGKDPQENPFIVCGLCAVWIPLREDATASDDDLGICPRKEWPHNRTKANDGCKNGVWPVE